MRLLVLIYPLSPIFYFLSLIFFVNAIGIGAYLYMCSDPWLLFPLLTCIFHLDTGMDLGYQIREHRVIHGSSYLNSSLDLLWVRRQSSWFKKSSCFWVPHSLAIEGWKHQWSYSIYDRRCMLTTIGLVSTPSHRTTEYPRLIHSAFLEKLSSILCATFLIEAAGLIPKAGFYGGRILCKLISQC